MTKQATYADVSFLSNLVVVVLTDNPFIALVCLILAGISFLFSLKGN